MIDNPYCLKPVKHDWCYKWSPLARGKLREGVKGPFTHPVVAVPFPCTFDDDTNRCDCADEVQKCYSKRGIPDPWHEYIMVKQGSEKGYIHPDEFPKTDLKITKSLGENYRLDFGQGIPDPWKNWIALKEPNLEDLKRGWKSYCENMRTRCGLYDTDRICCPNCNRQLLVFCMNKPRRNAKTEKKQKAAAEQQTEESGADESIPEKKVLKDASVETDAAERVKPVEACTCKVVKSCQCQREEPKPKICKHRKDDDDSSVCGRHSHSRHAPAYIYSFIPFIPRLPANQAPWSPPPSQEHANLPNEAYIREQQSYRPPHTLPNLPPSPAQFEPYNWFPPGFPDCGNRNGHFFELKWVCPRCERKKKRRHTSGQPASPVRHECRPCVCDKSRQGKHHSFGRNDDESGSESCGIYKISRVRNRVDQKKTSQTPRCHCDEGTSWIRNDERDIMQFLQMLGCTDVYRNKSNPDYNEPIVNLNFGMNPVSASRRVTHAPTPGSPNPNISHWKHPPDGPRRVVPTRNETNNRIRKYEDRQRPSLQNYKPGNIKTTYLNVDKLQNVNTVTRRRKKEEMNYFTSTWNTNGHESSSTGMERTKLLDKRKR